jgi:predicted nucleic acid-binding protein
MLEILLRTPRGERAAARLVQVNDELHVPHLLDVEFAQVLRRLLRIGRIDVEESERALEDLRVFPVMRHPHLPLLTRIWELRNSVSAYDATYVALAEALDAPLMTCDTGLSRSHGHRADIVLLT